MEAKYTAWRNTYLRSSPSSLYCYYNSAGNNGNAITCSEAHGYAMLISVLHRNKPDFDGLFTFFLNFRNNHGLMCWQIRSPHQPSSPVGPVQPYVEEDGKTSATDGDVDIASSLYLASRVFGEGDGGYRLEADKLASAILRWTIHPELGTPLMGDWANRDSEEASKLYDATRTSDFILSAFALFARQHRDPAERQRWGWVLESTKRVALSCGGTTGFLPDFLQYDAKTATWHPPKGHLLESEHDGALNWNACRTPWRLAHYLATTGDTTILPLLQHAHGSVRRIKAFNFPSIPAGIKLDGHEAKALVDYSDKAFIAPVGYLCHVLGDAEGQQSCVRALGDEEASYFGDSIDVLIAEQASHSHEWLL
ncbi:related to Endoglucanase [Ustilago sp. UG-2017b]|nr:related to Endoglucanase [Ustilago sp. UG-2017b]